LSAIQDAKRFSNILNVAAADLGQTMIDGDGHTACTLRFANGLRAHSMSSNADAQAGKRGDRSLDEFALHPDPRKLYEIAYPGITWADHWKSSQPTGAVLTISMNCSAR
jgi:phage FluMu gp28-like protein